MSSSYGSLWPGVPASANIVKSQDVYATATTPLTVIGGGGQQPSSILTAPGVPVQVGAITNSQIPVQFNISSVTGSPPLSFYGLFGTADPPTLAVSTIALDVSTLQCVIPPLDSLTNYYFASGVVNPGGTVSSATLGPIATQGAPDPGPTLPVNVSPGVSTITAATDVSAVVGVPTPVYTMTYVLSTGGTTQQVSTVNTGGNIWTAYVSSLALDSVYNFEAFASNVYGTRGSGLSVLSTLGGGPPPPIVGPNIAPTIPALVSATSSSLVVSFDAAGVTGTPTPTYGVYYDLDNPNPNTFASATLSTGTIYTAVVNGLIPSRNYYFESIAQNSGGVSTSAASVAYSTILGDPNQPPAIPVQVGAITNQQITIQFDTTGVTGTAPLSYYALYGTSPSPTTAVSTTLYNANTQQAIFPLLNSLTNYYFASGVVNPVGTLSSAVLGPIATQGPASAPAVPVLVSAGVSTITASTDASAVVGTPTPTIYMTYNQVPGGTAVEVSTVNTGGNIWTAYVSSLTANTNYGFTAQAINKWGGNGSETALFSTIT